MYPYPFPPPLYSRQQIIASASRYPAPEYLYIDELSVAQHHLSSIVPGDVVALDIEWAGSEPSGLSRSEKEAQRLREADDLANFSIQWDKILISIVQVAAKDRPVLLLDFREMKAMPTQFLNICSSPVILKTGAGIENDCLRLWKDFRISLKAVASLSFLAKLVRPLTFKPDEPYASVPSLADIVLYTAGYVLDKGKQANTSVWNMRPLRPEQLLYAAIDADASLHAYRKLSQEILSFDIWREFDRNWFTFDFHHGIPVKRDAETKWVAHCPWWSCKPEQPQRFVGRH